MPAGTEPDGEVVACRPGCDFERRATADLKGIRADLDALCRSNELLNANMSGLLAGIVELAAMERADPADERVAGRDVGVRDG